MLGLGMSSPLTASTITNTKNVNPLSSVGRVNLTLNGAILVYQRYLQTKWSQGFIYYNLSAYYVNNHLIYLLCSHLTANGNGGYWLAGNEGQYGGHNTGSSSFEEPLGFTLGYMEQSEKFIKYNPMNDICQGYAGEVTNGLSIDSSASSSGYSVSGTYSITYQYRIPMFEIYTESLTETKASWDFSDNQYSTGVKPYAATYAVGTVATAMDSGYNSICIVDQGQFAHSGAWFSTNHCWKSSTDPYCFELCQ